MKNLTVLGILPTINATACLLINGQIVAMAEEERFSRIKASGHVVPLKAIEFVIKYAGITMDDIDYIAISWDHTKYTGFMKEFAKKNFQERTKIDYLVEQLHEVLFNPDYLKYQLQIGLSKIGLKGKLPEVKFISHHLSHAASTFYLSGFNEAVILTLDGSGEEKATVLWEGRDSEIKILKEINLPNSLGWFYSCITEFLGFSSYTGEGKVMGLAPYGKENLEIREKLSQIIHIYDSGYTIDPTYIYFNKRSRSFRFTDKLIALLGEPVTNKGYFNQYHKDIAYETQYLLEKAVTNLVSFCIKTTGIRKVCIAGGVGMNCKMNGKIRKMPIVEDLFVIPPSSDNGSCLGSALIICLEQRLNPKKYPLKTLYLGPEFSNEEIEKVLKYCKLKYCYYENIEEITAKKIQENKIVGWFQGRMEVGARALGSRSILANPLNPDMKDIINARVKHRESFRPFCPSILFEDMDVYIENPQSAPYMIIAFDAKEEMRKKLPAVVHVDNSIRPQTVTREANSRFWKLINEFKKLTGYGVIINTSFNVADEPIVCTPQEAVRCFAGTGIDCLSIGNFFLEKETN